LCLNNLVGNRPATPEHFVNGRTRQVSGAMTMGQLASSCGLDARRLLVELNNHTLSREEWPDACSGTGPGRIYPGGGRR